MSNVTLR